MKFAHLVLALLLIPGMSIAQKANSSNKNIKNKEDNMSTIQKNKEIIRNVYDHSLNNRNFELLKDIISDDYVGIRQKGVTGFLEPIHPLIKAFPDVQWKLEEVVSEGDKVAVKWKLQGTHKKPFNNFAATGKIVSNEGMAVFELKEGKVIKSVVQTDRLGFFQQLEALPSDLSVFSKKVSKDKVSFIDKFFVPGAAKKEFYERMRINRSFIKGLPGFIDDAVYEYIDPNGNLICITIAHWENNEALNKAKEAVQAEYKKQGFDTADMFKRLNIVADRGVYTELKH